MIALGGALLTSALVFSFASGIFHPYYISFLAPFTAALVGAGVGTILPRALGGVGEGQSARIVAPLAIGGGVITELVVLGGLSGALAWAVPGVIVLAGAAAVLLALTLPVRIRAALVAVSFAALLAAPAAWAVQTLGHPTSSTFPAGGSATASTGGPGAGFGGGFRHFRSGVGGAGQGFAGGPPPGLAQGSGSAAGGGFAPSGLFGGVGGGFAGGGGPFGANSASLTAVINYAKAHGGGTIGVASQSSAAAAILSSDGNVAGLGGFSGRESAVTPQWLAMEVRLGRLRWVIVDGSQGFSLHGDTRTGSQDAFSIVEKTCPAVTVTTSSGGSVTMYDCAGHASAILAAANG